MRFQAKIALWSLDGTLIQISNSKHHFESTNKHFFDQSELSTPQNLTRLEEKLEKLKLALEGQKPESLNRRKRAPSSDGLFYGHDLGITELDESGEKVFTTSFM